MTFIRIEADLKFVANYLVSETGRKVITFFITLSIVFTL